MLLTALAARGDGVSRRDLFVWNWRTGAVRRVTHGAGIRHADVSPDGLTAIADRCIGGRCDLVRVNLATGAITTLAPGDRTHLYNRPRISRDGSTIAFAVQREDGWRVATMPFAGGDMSIVSEASSSAYAPEFARGGADLVFTSEDGGVANIVRIDRATGARSALTNASGAAIDPEASESGWVYFLRLHARGLDLARVRLGSAAQLADSTRPRFPWVLREPAVAALDSLPVSSIPNDRAYGLGPRAQLLLIFGSWAREGKSAGLAYAGTDPVGRLTWLAQGQWGDRASWRGASLAAAYRGWRPVLGVEGFALENQPSRQHDFETPSVFDARYRAVSAWTELEVDRQSLDFDVRGLASLGTVDPIHLPSMRRALAQLSISGGLVQTPQDWRMTERVAVRGAVGELGDESWSRVVVTGSFAIKGGGYQLAVDALYGALSTSAPQFERFALGGLAPPLDGLLDPRAARVDAGASDRRGNRLRDRDVTRVAPRPDLATVLLDWQRERPERKLEPGDRNRGRVAHRRRVDRARARRHPARRDRLLTHRSRAPPLAGLHVGCLSALSTARVIAFARRSRGLDMCPNKDRTGDLWHLFSRPNFAVLSRLQRARLRVLSKGGANE